MIPSTSYWVPQAEHAPRPHRPPPVLLDNEVPPHVDLSRGIQAVLRAIEEISREHDGVRQAVEDLRKAVAVLR